MVFSFFLIQLTYNLKNKHPHTPSPLSHKHTDTHKDLEGTNMCMNTSEFDLYRPLCSTTHRRPSFKVHRRHRRRILKQSKDKARSRARILRREMEMRNLKLYMDNRSIIEENEKLRKKALLLHQENRVLLCQLQNAPSMIPPNSSQTQTSI